jgi:hypothetical protein
MKTFAGFLSRALGGAGEGGKGGSQDRDSVEFSCLFCDIGRFQAIF